MLTLLILSSAGGKQYLIMTSHTCHLDLGYYPYLICSLVVFGLNGPLRQYFSLYRGFSQREGERKEK